MKKEFTVMECLGIQEWYEDAKITNKLNGLSVSTLWILRKNMKKIDETAEAFKEFKVNLENTLKQDYFGDDKSEETTIEEDGREMLVRKVKDQFLSEYQAAVHNVNENLATLAATKEEFNFIPIDMEKEVEKIGATCDLSLKDLDILSIFEQN